RAGGVGIRLEVASLRVVVVLLELVAALADLAVGVAVVVDGGGVSGSVHVFGVGGALRAGQVAGLIPVGRCCRSLLADVVSLVVGEVDQRPLRHPELGLLGV